MQIMLEQLESLDRSLFLFLNNLHSDWLDTIMWHISGKWEWIPLYAILLFLIIKKFGKASWIIVLLAGVLITVVDQTSVHLFKEMVERYRPCHNLDIQNLVHLVNNKCGGKFGFVSSHAANTFALANYLGLLLAFNSNKKIWYLLLVWALIVSYSRIYLGVHYPADIIGGALLGSILGIITYKVCISIIRKSYD